MIRGLVPKDRLLEWTVEDGWEPLCAFLGKPVPDDEPFPHVNAAAGWEGQEAKEMKKFLFGALEGLAVLVAFSACAGTAVYQYLF
jgi:hypothetical protein